jgi:prevent-host-death family protein
MGFQVILEGRAILYCLYILENIMPAPASYGLEQARIQLPAIVANAHAGKASIITRHGKPYAAVVPLAGLEKARIGLSNSDLLALRGTGQGLWGADVGQTIANLRDEWEDEVGRK